MAPTEEEAKDAGSQVELQATKAIVVDGVVLSPFLSSPVTSKPLFLAGAGVRSIPIGPNVFLNVTVLGFYYDAEVLQLLSPWLGKTSEELLADESFFEELTKAPVEKFSRVTMLKPLPGAEFAKKVLENTQQVLEEASAFGEAEEKAVEEFREIFSRQHFTPGSGPYYVFNHEGIGIGFSVPDEEFSTKTSHFIPNKAFGEALLSTMIGKTSVSPAAKASIAERLSFLLKYSHLAK